MQIRKLVEKIEYKLLAGSLDTEITSLVYDSRKVPASLRQMGRRDIGHLVPKIISVFSFCCVRCWG